MSELLPSKPKKRKLAEMSPAEKAELTGWRPWATERTLASGDTAWVCNWHEPKTGGGRRFKRKQFSTPADLDSWVDAQQNERIRKAEDAAKEDKRGDTVVTLARLSPAERAAVAQAIEAIRTAGGRVEAVAEAARLFADTRLSGAKKTVEEIANEHLEAVAQRRRPATYRDRRQFLKTFVEQRGKSLAATITPAEVERWVLSIDKPPSQAARRRAVNALFSFAVKRGYLKENPVATVERIQNHPADAIHVFTPKDAKELLTRARRMEPHLVPYLAIGLFAGLRPDNELKNLDWANVRLDTGLITVTRSTSKTSRVRHVPIQPNLAAWLRVVPKAERTGRIYSYRRGLRRVLGREGKKDDKKPKPLPWAQDIMRHSYASYRQAIIKNINQLVEEMGNTPHVARAHYLNPPPEATAKEFWAIVPTSGKKESKA